MHLYTISICHMCDGDVLTCIYHYIGTIVQYEIICYYHEKSSNGSKGHYTSTVHDYL